ADEVQGLRLARPGVHAVGAAGEVDDGLCEGFVQRHQRVAEAGDALLVAERLAQRLTEHDRGVLDGVVGVDVGVARRRHLQVEAGVGAQRREHVVEERHRGGDVHRAGAVHVEGDLDGGFAGGAGEGRGAGPTGGGAGRLGAVVLGHRGSASSRAVRNAALSSGVPRETRSQPAGPTARMRTPRARSPSNAASRSVKLRNRMKFASDGATSWPRAARWVASASRSERSRATLPSSSSRWARAVRATAWVTADRWEGRRTTRTASTTAGPANRWPSRAPASAKALDIVRVTTGFGCFARRVRALGTPARRNSPYASSTTSRPRVGASAAAAASTTSSPRAV